MAERIINDILGDINSTIVNTVSFGSLITTNRLCYLQTKDAKTFPLLNTGTGQGTMISWDDKYPLQIYHRILDMEKEIDQSRGYGNKPYEERVYFMRLVGIGSKDALSSTGYEDNQDFCNAVSDAIPNFVNQNEYIQTGDHEVIKQTVYSTEFAGITEMEKLSLEGVAFWIDYELRVEICDVTPTSPTNLVATANVDSISLSWDGTGVSFGIERSLFSETGFVEIATSNSNTYTDSNVSGPNTFYYRVRKKNPNSGYSNIANATVGGGSVVAPTNLVATSAGVSSIDLTWDSSGGAFEIQRSLTSGSGFVQVGATSEGNTSFTDNDLDDDTTYYYRVREIGVVDSDFSNEANATTDRIELSITVQTDNAGTTSNDQFQLPMFGTTDFNVNWGDGSEDLNQTGTLTHTYSSAGNYTITVWGNDYNLYFNNGGDRQKITGISNFGSCKVLQSSFYGCSNLDITATNVPIVESPSMIVDNLFRNCSVIEWNSSINDIDMAGITSMRNVFNNAFLFNQDLNSWDLTDVTSIQEIFKGATAFNGDISGWDVSLVENMEEAFSSASAFNINIGGWNTGAVTDFRNMFLNASSFDQDISSWDFGSSANGLQNFLSNTNMSTANYDALLIAWEADSVNLELFITVGVSGLTYTLGGAAETARANLISNNFWVFNGDSGV